MFPVMHSRRSVCDLAGSQFDNNKPLIKALTACSLVYPGINLLANASLFPGTRVASSSGVMCSCCLIRLCKGLKIIQEYQTTPTRLCRH